MTLTPSSVADLLARVTTCMVYSGPMPLTPDDRIGDACVSLGALLRASGPDPYMFEGCIAIKGVGDWVMFYELGGRPMMQLPLREEHERGAGDGAVVVRTRSFERGSTLTVSVTLRATVPTPEPIKVLEAPPTYQDLLEHTRRIVVRSADQRTIAVCESRPDGTYYDESGDETGTAALAHFELDSGQVCILPVVAHGERVEAMSLAVRSRSFASGQQHVIQLSRDLLLPNPPAPLFTETPPTEPGFYWVEWGSRQRAVVEFGKRAGYGDNFVVQSPGERGVYSVEEIPLWGPRVPEAEELVDD